MKFENLQTLSRFNLLKLESLYIRNHLKTETFPHLPYLCILPFKQLTIQLATTGIFSPSVCVKNAFSLFLSMLLFMLCITHWLIIPILRKYWIFITKTFSLNFGPKHHFQEKLPFEPHSSSNLLLFHN